MGKGINATLELPESSFSPPIACLLCELRQVTQTFYTVIFSSVQHVSTSPIKGLALSMGLMITPPSKHLRAFMGTGLRYVGEDPYCPPAGLACLTQSRLLRDDTVFVVICSSSLGFPIQWGRVCQHVTEEPLH